MIPKIIHYCWFGKAPLPKLTKQCIRSWKKHCPDFEIKEWNETNSPLHLFPFAQQALEEKKWAFVADVIRLYALYTEGGIYLDTDVELLKPLTPFLHHEAFIGYEKDLDENGERVIQTALIGSVPHNGWVTSWLKIYEGKTFSAERTRDFVNSHLIADKIRKKGFQLNGSYLSLPGLTIYPSDYFCPMSCISHFIERTGNTVSIHYFSYSWMEDTWQSRLKKLLVGLVGEKAFRKLVNFVRQRLLPTKK